MLVGSPTLLTNNNRFNEIYNLRLAAYENNPAFTNNINEKYPDGWRDELDELENFYHWIIEDNGRIIASARLTVLNSISDIGQSIDSLAIPKNTTFAYWSRLVVHPNYRKSFAMQKLDRFRKEFVSSHSTCHFSICFAQLKRENALIRSGFKHLCNLSYDYGWEKKELGAYMLEKPIALAY